MAHPNVKRKAASVETLVKEQFQGAKCSMQLVTATNLLNMAREAPRVSYQLAVTDQPINTRGGIIGLVNLREYLGFISDEKDELRRNLFEANVRDYQGSTQVNAEIQKALSEQWSEDFWWLNNGKWGIHLTQVAPRRCGLVDPWTPAHCTQNAPWGARRRSAGNWATRLRFGPIKDYARAMAIAGLETWCYRQAFPGAANGQPQYVVVT